LCMVKHKVTDGIAYDAASKFLCVILQVKHTAVEMVKSMLRFEQLWNGATEHIIESVVQSAKTMLLEAYLRWSEVMEKSLWPCALQYAVYLHNIKPTVEYGVSPLDVLPRTKRNLYDLLYTHGWGCPTSIVPNWESRSRRGQYVGYHSPLLHASSVGVNLNTQNVPLQFHVMYNDFFESKTSNESNPPSVKIWERLYDQVDWNSELLDLAEEWLSPGMKQSRIVQTEGASPQQLPAQTTTPVSQVSPCQVLPGLVQREQQVGSAERALAQAFSQEDLRVPFVEKAAAPSPQKHEAPVVQGLSPVAQASSNAVDPIRGQSIKSIRGVASQRFTYKVKGQPTIYSLVECFYKLIPGLVACEDQREHKQREFLAMMSSCGTIEKWPRPLGWTYVGNDGISGEDSRKHSSGLETRRMRGSVAGHTGAGQSLSSGQEYDGLDSLSRQASPSVSPGMYQVSAHGRRLVRESVASRTTVMIPMGLRLQHQQLGCKQWYQVDLATGLQQQVQGHRRWYLVVDGTVLLWQQQQGRRNGYLVCTWLRQQKGRQQARPCRPGIQAKQQGCMLVRRGLRQWQQEQSHRLDMPRRPSTQAKQSRPSTSIGRQNYSVPRPHSVGQVPRMDDSCGTKATHHGPMCHNGCLVVRNIIPVPRLRSIAQHRRHTIYTGTVPNRDVTVLCIEKLSVTILYIEKLPETIQRIGCGTWL